MKLAFVFLASIAILASPTMARMMVEWPDQLVDVDASFGSCLPFILEASSCVVDVVKAPTGPHPSCCKAISSLNDCAPKIYGMIPPADMDIIKKFCNL